MAMSDGAGEHLHRPVFFERQSLTRDDLNCLVDYVRETRRRHNRHVVGWGVSCGLPVTAVDGAPWQVAVGRGYAVMPSGEEVAVPDGALPFDVCEAARACLGIPGPCPEPLDLEAPQQTSGGARSTDFTILPEGSVGENPRDLGWATIQIFTIVGGSADVTRIQRFGAFTGLDLGTGAVLGLAAPADAVRVELVYSLSPPVLIARDAAGTELDRQAMTTGVLEAQAVTLEGTDITTVEIEPPEYDGVILRLDVPLVARGEAYLALCPEETPACFTAGVPPHCQPPGENIHPSRIREGYRLTVLCELPEGHSPPLCDEIDAMICGPAHVPAPPDGGADCVVIATLAVGTEGIVAIDEFRDRRRLLPHWVLAEREQCRCTPPTTDPTIFSPPTEPTIPTILTPTVFTPTILTPTVFTPTVFTVFTPTFLTVFTPTFFTVFTPTVFTVFTPTVFTQFTPSLFTFLNPPGLPDPPIGFPASPLGTAPTEPSAVVDPDPLRFDPVAGRALAVDAVPDIGTARAARLRAIGVLTVTDLVERGSAELAASLGLSEVRVAELQDVARRVTVDRDR